MLSKAKKLIRSGWKPDVIYASATPYTSLITANKISRLFDVPWVEN